MLREEVLEGPLQMLKLLRVGTRIARYWRWGACEVRVVVQGGREEEGDEGTQGLRREGEVEEGLSLGGLDGGEGSCGGEVATSRASERNPAAHLCDVRVCGGAQREVRVLLCSEHVNILQVAGCVW